MKLIISKPLYARKDATLPGVVAEVDEFGDLKIHPQTVYVDDKELEVLMLDLQEFDTVKLSTFGGSFYLEGSLYHGT